MTAHLIKDRRDTLTVTGFVFGKSAYRANPGPETESFLKASADAEFGPGKSAFASG